MTDGIDARIAQVRAKIAELREEMALNAIELHTAQTALRKLEALKRKGGSVTSRDVTDPNLRRGASKSSPDVRVLHTKYLATQSAVAKLCGKSRPTANAWMSRKPNARARIPRTFVDLLAEQRPKGLGIPETFWPRIDELA